MDVVPTCRMNVKVALTNKIPTTPVRGAGHPQAAFAMERLRDRIAGNCPSTVKVRRRNFIPPDAMPYEKQLLREAACLSSSTPAITKRCRAKRWSVPAGRPSMSASPPHAPRDAISELASEITSKAPGADHLNRQPCV